jgi:hypothetical protein
MRVGLQAGFGTSLQSEFAGIAAHGFTLIRQDVYGQGDPAAVPALVAECAGAPVQMIFLIGGGHICTPDGTQRIEPDELAVWTEAVVDAATAAGVVGYAIEVGNEPDIAHPDYADHPADFAEAIRLCHIAARGAGFQGAFITGGISNLNRRGLGYLAGMLGASRFPTFDVIIGFHRYPEAGRGPFAPHRGFTSREDEWEALQNLVSQSGVACTEFGYHTAASEPITLTDADVANAVLWDLAFYRERRVPLAVVYQLNDGVMDDWINRYGVRTTAGTWKPVAEAIQRAYGPPAG